MYEPSAPENHQRRRQCDGRPAAASPKMRQFAFFRLYSKRAHSPPDFHLSLLPLRHPFTANMLPSNHGSLTLSKLIAPPPLLAHTPSYSAVRYYFDLFCWLIFRWFLFRFVRSFLSAWLPFSLSVFLTLFWFPLLFLEKEASVLVALLI